MPNDSKFIHERYYSPLRYPGGKAALYPLIEKIIDSKKVDSLVYVEPFAGGAAVALSLLISGKVNKIVINDLDIAIYSFWKAIINDTEKFIEKMMRATVSVNAWKRQKNIYESKKKGYFKLGFATFYLNRTNRSGVLNGGPIGGTDQKGKWKIGARFNKRALAIRIRKIADHADCIVLKKEDGIKLARRYLGRKKVLMFVDPPYYVKGSCLYLSHYEEKDHKNLARLLNRNADSAWLLTYDNVKNTRSLYPDRKKRNFKLNYCVRDSRVGSEILIASDAITLPKEIV